MPAAGPAPHRRRCAAAWLTTLAAGALLAACGSSGHQAAPTTTTRPATTTATTPATTAPTTAAPTSAAGPTEFMPTHRAVADALFAAWQAHDRAKAQKIATPAAVDSLFGVDPKGWYRYTYKNVYCDTGEFDEGNCNYRDDNGNYAQVHLTHDQHGWWADAVVISHHAE